MRKLTIVVCTALLGTAGSAPAQVSGRYQVSATGGYANWAESSALKGTVFGGLDARYQITDNLGVGFYFYASRPNTDGTFFPLVRLDFGDTVLVYTVSQQVGAFDYGLEAAFRLPVGGRLSAVGMAGFGQYAFNLDPQQTDAPKAPGDVDRTFRKTEYMVGGALELGLGEGTGIRIEVRDFVYTSFDREWFNVSDPLLREENIPHPRPDLPENKDTIHNLRYSIGFTFTPGR